MAQPPALLRQALRGDPTGDRSTHRSGALNVFDQVWSGGQGLIRYELCSLERRL